MRSKSERATNTSGSPTDLTNLEEVRNSMQRTECACHGQVVCDLRGWLTGTSRQPS